MPTFSTFGQQHIKISDGALAECVAARIQELARSPAPLRPQHAFMSFPDIAPILLAVEAVDRSKFQRSLHLMACMRAFVRKVQTRSGLSRLIQENRLSECLKPQPSSLLP
jgi:hypothetical protein